MFIVNNFWHSLFSAWYDVSFESSERVLFKNVYFYCVKVVRYPVRESYHISNIQWKLFELTLALKMPKIMSNLALERYVNWLPFKCRSRKIFFHALAFLVSEILPINSVPGKQSIVNNFWHSLLSTSWDPSFESPGGVLFKNVHFYCVKVVSFPVRESDHMSNIKRGIWTHLNIENGKN